VKAAPVSRSFDSTADGHKQQIRRFCCKKRAFCGQDW